LAREPQASVFRHGCQIRPSPRSASEPDRPDATLLNSLTWPYFIARQPRPTNCSQKKAWLKPKATLTKGTNGRYNPAPNGDRFRNLITRRESAGFIEKTILALREHEEMGLSHAHRRGENGLAKAIPMNLALQVFTPLRSSRCHKMRDPLRSNCVCLKEEMEETSQLRVSEDARAVFSVVAERMTGFTSQTAEETLAVEEPLEIQLGYATAEGRAIKSVSVTMRTPGYDFELAAGFLMTEGVVRDVNDIERIAYAGAGNIDEAAESSTARSVLPYQPWKNIVRVELATGVTVSLANLQRNFYTTSSCGICGKASLLALQSVCPARSDNRFAISAETLYTLPARLRAAQSVFDRTGGLHGAGLFNAGGELLALREDVGRHNAVDKLLGAEFLADRTPLRDSLLLLSGRASFELLQKALMGGVAMVASVGAPSSLAVRVAKDFDITLVGFLRDHHFNVYHGAQRVSGCKQRNEQGAL